MQQFNNCKEQVKDKKGENKMDGIIPEKERIGKDDE
jgi:hypothetical protein